MFSGISGKTSKKRRFYSFWIFSVSNEGKAALIVLDFIYYIEKGERLNSFTFFMYLLDGVFLFDVLYGSLVNMRLVPSLINNNPSVRYIYGMVCDVVGKIDSCFVRLTSVANNLERLTTFAAHIQSSGVISNCVSELYGRAVNTSGCVVLVVGLLVDCVVRGDFQFSNHAGGLSLYMWGGTILRCMNLANIQPYEDSPEGKAAGIVAEVSNYATIKVVGCTNVGNITGGSGDGGSAAGICGIADVTSVIKTDNVNVGNVTANASYPLYWGVA